MSIPAETKSEIIETGKIMYDKGFVPGTAGNISVLCDNKIYITASGSCLGRLKETDIAVYDLDSLSVIGNAKPSSEFKMHLSIYKNRPEIRAIVHGHPPKATTCAVSGIELKEPLVAEAYFSLGEVPIVNYSLPSSDKLAQEVANAFTRYEAVLMANHGAAVIGKSLKNALYKFETLEAYAEITLWTKLLGRSNPLSNEDLVDITRLKEQTHKS